MSQFLKSCDNLHEVPSESEYPTIKTRHKCKKEYFRTVKKPDKNCEHNVSQLCYSGQSGRSPERSECQSSKTRHNF